MSWDDGSWNKWTNPDGFSYQVCHACFTSPRRQWREEFSLYKNAGLGIVYTPRGFPTTELELQHLRVSLDRHQERQMATRCISQTYQKTKQAYKYVRLDDGQIRILTILPGEGNDDLCCTLEHVDIDEAESLKYEALSYRCEESPEEARTIWINSCTFAVSHPLFVAMTFLCDLMLSRTIWIDAISVKQVSDHDKDLEKMIQIRLMGKIYRHAYEVIIWLGAATDDSDSVMDVIADGDVKRMQSSEFANGFAKLSLRSWFFRTWILQEFALPKFPPKVVCGSKTVTSGQFMAVHAFLDELERHSAKAKVNQGWSLTEPVPVRMKPVLMLASPIARLIDLRSATRDNEGNMRQKSLARTLRYNRESGVTDVRDKIYGALGLTNETIHDFFKADSMKSISDTYTDAMTYMLNVEAETYETEVLELFLTYPCSLTLSEPISDLPSWVPDFSRNHILLELASDYTWFWLNQITRSDGRKPLVNFQHGRHHITTEQIDRSRFKVYDKTLFVEGFLVDEITDIASSAFYQDSPRDTKSALARFFGPSADSQKVAEWFRPALDRLYGNAETITFNDMAQDPELTFAHHLGSFAQSKVLYKVEEICRQHVDQLDGNTHSGEWMTFTWRDLFERYGEVHKMSEEQFQLGFHCLVGITSPMFPADWTGMDGKMRSIQEKGGLAARELAVPFTSLFNAPKCFFMTRTSGLYGISPPAVEKGDKLVF